MFDTFDISLVRPNARSRGSIGKEELPDSPSLPRKRPRPTEDTISPSKRPKFDFPFLPCIPFPPIPVLPSPNAATEDTIEESHPSGDPEREIFKMIAAQRNLRSEEWRQNLAEIKKKQLYAKALHEELNKLQKYLEEHAKASEKLEWASGATTIGLVILSVAGFVSALLSGGYTTTINTLGLVGSTANSAINVTGQVMQLQSQEKEGLAKELQELRSLENELVQKILADNQHAFQNLHTLWTIASEIIRNQNLLKLSS